jgi:tRNA(adenine34) deaminase
MLFSEETYRFMHAALAEARIAMEEGEIPVGAVIVAEGKIIGKGHNSTEKLKDPTAHAEILAIREASEFIGEKFLSECDIYITVEPCMMCAGAILLSRIRHVYFGAFEPKFGACGSVFNLIETEKYNHRPKVFSGILAEESEELLKKYFESKRKNN